MKVLQVNTEHGWRGGERQTLLTLQGLQARGVDSRLVAQPDSPLEARARDAGIKTYPLKMKGPADLAAAFKLAGICRKEGVDILHLQTSHAASLGALSRLFVNPVAMVAARRVDFPIRSGWKYNRFDAVVPISGAIEQILIDGGVDAEKLVKIASGIDTNFTPPDDVKGLREELFGGAEFAIGSIGHLTDHKGQKFLLMAMPEILRAIPGARLALIGGGELRGELEDLALELDLGEAVVFTGFREDAPVLIHTFDIFVHPSRLEGLCTTILDVLLRRVPVIASKVGGIPEATGGGRYARLVEAENPEALAGAVIDLWKNPPGEEHLVAGAEFVNESFSVDAMVEKTLELYRRLKKRT